MAGKPFPLTVISGGINRLRTKGGADRNNLYELLNGYVTQANTVKVRPGTTRDANIATYSGVGTTKGLVSYQGQKHIFSHEVVSVPPGYALHVVNHPATQPGTSFTDIAVAVTEGTFAANTFFGAGGSYGYVAGAGGYSAHALLTPDPGSDVGSVSPYSLGTGYPNVKAFFQTDAQSDAHFADVSLLLHCDGVNGATTIVDSSSNGHTTTPFGSAALETGTVEFGTAALSLPAVSTSAQSYLPYPIVASGPLDVLSGSSDLTIEGWFYYPSASSGDLVVFDMDGPAGYSDTTHHVALQVGGGGYITMILPAGWSQVVSTNAWAKNTWHHFALVRASGAATFYLDGVAQAASQPWSGYTLRSGATIWFGGTTALSGGLAPGYVDEIRITKGVARYTANFTPPTQASQSDPSEVYIAFDGAMPTLAKVTYPVSGGTATVTLGAPSTAISTTATVYALGTVTPVYTSSVCDLTIALPNAAQAPIPLKEIHFAAQFLGGLYVVAEFATNSAIAAQYGSVFHYWIQSSTLKDTSNAWQASTDYQIGDVVIPTTPNGLTYIASRRYPANPLWTASTLEVVNNIVEPNVPNGFKYTCTVVTGTNPSTGLAEPTWPTTDGATVQEFSSIANDQTILPASAAPAQPLSTVPTRYKGIV